MVGDPAVKVSALQWSITAMSDTTERLARVNAGDRPQAFALIGEAVWWVTIVDATLVRYHPWGRMTPCWQTRLRQSAG